MSCQHGNWPPCEYCDEIETNVAHATAAKDAEIEALRAEVERLQSINLGLCRKSNYYLIDSARWQERAERLAEALRAEIPVLRRIAGFGNMSDEMTAGVADRLEALLGEQESNDA